MASRDDVTGVQPPGPTFEVRAAHFSGPLPPPALLRQYDELLPGCADRILSMVESNSRHRQALEAKVVDATCKVATRGQVLGFALAFTVIVLGAGLIHSGHETQGFAMIVGTATSLIGAFMWGRLRQEKARRDKLASRQRQDT